jgi:hypothetical protein
MHPTTSTALRQAGQRAKALAREAFARQRPPAVSDAGSGRLGDLVPAPRTRRRRQRRQNG